MYVYACLSRIGSLKEKLDFLTLLANLKDKSKRPVSKLCQAYTKAENATLTIRKSTREKANAAVDLCLRDSLCTLPSLFLNEQEVDPDFIYTKVYVEKRTEDIDFKALIHREALRLAGIVGGAQFYTKPLTISELIEVQYPGEAYLTKTTNSIFKRNVLYIEPNAKRARQRGLCSSDPQNA